RGLDRVAVLEADAGALGERAVADVERGSRRRQLGQRRVRRAALGVVEGQVALAEGPARAVLAGQPDRRAVAQDRGEGERLGVTPVDRGVGAGEGVAAALEGALELRVRLEPLREAQQ